MEFHWKIGIFQTLRLELVGEDPTPAVVLSFPFDCLVRKFATFVRRSKYLGYFILSSRLFENVRKRAEQRDEAHFTKLVDNSAIAENYYNQSGSSYVEQEDKREKIDIVELNERIEKIVARENELLLCTLCKGAHQVLWKY